MEMKPFNGKLPVKQPVIREEFNDIILEQIGLVENEEGILVDEDQDFMILIRGKMLVLNPNHPAIQQHTAILYDPAGNPSIMDRLFKYYIEKLDTLSGVETRTIAYSNSAKNERSCVEVVKADGKTYRSDMFFNDNIKCGDLVIKLNSAINPYDFSKLDRELYDENLKAVELKSKRRKTPRK